MRCFQSSVEKCAMVDTVSRLHLYEAALFFTVSRLFCILTRICEAEQDHPRVGFYDAEGRQRDRREEISGHHG